MAAISSIKLDLEAKSQVYRFFISYAREDEKIAIAVYNALETAMGPSAKVLIDSGLRFGLSFQDKIKKKFDETDTLVVIDSAVLKPAFWLYGNGTRVLHQCDGTGSGPGIIAPDCSHLSG